MIWLIASSAFLQSQLFNHTILQLAHLLQYCSKGELYPCVSRYKDQVIEAAKAASEETAGLASPTSSAEGGAALREGAEAAEGGGDSDAEDEEGGKRDAPMGLPISLVKRIMCCDEDVQRVTSGAVRATARAAELFLQVGLTPPHLTL